ncbi:hypothetical protein [Photobacterium iliopiscarium]|uniref:hypothetical protein n=1 Tax=Photobacterium iliopiscarium TaxID=56192 RepID=UPI001E599E8A|nr:hypothetical protein [Photobacterium iliopiscarium]MCD9485897.1 hypothetical protein [Photobacterium iliopiscarium]MCF2242594.1 hypothetical protein [Photobacterium iliopiscarium]
MEIEVCILKIGKKRMVKRDLNSLPLLAYDVKNINNAIARFSLSTFLSVVIYHEKIYGSYHIYHNLNFPESWYSTIPTQISGDLVSEFLVNNTAFGIIVDLNGTPSISFAEKLSYDDTKIKNLIKTITDLVNNPSDDSYSSLLAVLIDNRQVLYAAVISLLKKQSDDSDYHRIIFEFISTLLIDDSEIFRDDIDNYPKKKRSIGYVKKSLQDCFSFVLALSGLDVEKLTIKQEHTVIIKDIAVIALQQLSEEMDHTKRQIEETNKAIDNLPFICI